MPADYVPLTTTLDGSEKLLSANQTEVSVTNLRNFVLQNVLADLGIDQVDNTSDDQKPLSLAQKVYIDSHLLAMNNKIEQLIILMSKYVDTQGSL